MNEFYIQVETGDWNHFNRTDADAIKSATRMLKEAYDITPTKVTLKEKKYLFEGKEIKFIFNYE